MITTDFTRLLSSLLALCSLLISPLHAENIVFPDDSGVINVKTKYGAKGDGKTDDTAAIKQALEENRMVTIYFPNGTYLLSDSVGIFGGKSHSRDRFLQLQGQSEAGTILKLKDNTPAFGNPAAPKIFVSSYQGQSTGDVMYTNARNFTVDVGAGNPGAVAFGYFTNNFGTMEHITLRSSDPKGAGAIGLDLRQSQNGPGLIKNITVQGFDRGAVSGNSFSLVLEHITINGARQIAFDIPSTRVTIRGLKTKGAPIAVKMGKHTDLALIDATFTDGPGSSPAIIAEGDKIFLRNVSQSGYTGMAQTSSGNLAETTAKEWSPREGFSLFDGPKQSLNLNVLETPEIPWEEDLTKWIKVDSSQGNDITAQLQAAIDEAALTGKTTIYFPKVPGVTKDYILSGPIRVHGSINRILGLNNMLKINPTEKFKDGAAAFTFENLKSDAIVVERFFQIGGWDRPKTVAFENRSGKTIILKNMNLTCESKKADPGGLWFLDDFCPGRSRALEVGPRERVYARQYNPESPQGVMTRVNGGQMWILGLKTEGRSTHVLAENGAHVEVLGGVSYQSWGKQKENPPMFICTNSTMSVNIGFYHYKDPFTVAVEETQGGTTKTLNYADLKGYLPIYRSGK